MPFHCRHWRAAALAVLYWCAAPPAAMAQDWPSKPIRLVVPAPPGGITDGVARRIGEQLHVNLGQPVVVDNRPGGSGVVAERALMNAPADGYTMMVLPSSVLTDLPLSMKTPFDPNKTFSYVMDAAVMIHVLVANTSFVPNTVAAALDLARQGKGAVSVANLSPGLRSDMLGDLLREKSGRTIQVIPYKGSAPAMVDLLGNQVQMTFEVVTNAAPLIKSGKLKGLAVVSAARSPHLPQVPSFLELGMPEFVLPDASIGVALLSSTPAPLMARIRQELEKAVRAPSFRAAMAAQGFDVPPESTLEELQRKMAATMEQNRKILGSLAAASGGSR